MSALAWKRLLLGVLIVAGVATLGFVFQAGGPPSTLARWIVAIAFGGWTVLPYVVLGLLMGRLGPRLWGWIVFAAGTALVVGLAGWAYYSGFVLHLDPQSGILLVLVPFYQLVIVAPTALLGLWLSVERSRVDRTAQ